MQYSTPSFQNKTPFISIIIPVHNGENYIDKCLDSILASTYNPYEIIVVDDASTDKSAEISRGKGASVLRLDRQSGPAAARNFGAEKAKGEILFFVDSDIVVKPDTITRIAEDFMKNPEIVAVFGSYDDSPAASDLLSQYRNLFHHYIHQNSQSEAKTFWAGCGAIYREIFHQLNGFDEYLYTKPSIEDIELGLRMWKRGYRILLDKELQVKHLKHWKWRSCLKTDIFDRAIPWSRLILESGLLPRDLNLQIPHRISALLVGILVLTVIVSLLGALNLFKFPADNFFIASLALIATLLILNRKVYGFFYRERGLKFTVTAIPLHFLYYFYSGTSFAACWLLHRFPILRSVLHKANAFAQSLLQRN
ncbi:MAG TPA: glycosyltransferase family 2 protein [Thermodesulfobacteriota bacterium]|nr:glycosyltransferase family 2 protein [Thermodesulfobacteriota bacterium]